MESAHAFSFVMSSEQWLVLTGALLVNIIFGTHRLGVLIALVLAAHWGFIQNQERFFMLLDVSPGLTSSCLLGGGLLLALVYFKLVLQFVLHE
jgi:hypothetical protein